MNAAVLDTPAAPRAAPAFDAKGLVIGGAVALIAWLALVPLGFLLWQSFLTPETAAAAPRSRSANYVAAYGSTETLAAVLQLAAVRRSARRCSPSSSARCFAWMNERTNTPFKALFFALSIIPLIIPGILFTVSWILLASPKIGIINRCCRAGSAPTCVFVQHLFAWPA